jgi:hypothetical protein
MPGSNEQAASERHQERSAEPSGLKVAGLLLPMLEGLANVVIELFPTRHSEEVSAEMLTLYSARELRASIAGNAAIDLRILRCVPAHTFEVAGCAREPSAYSSVALQA